MSSYFCLHLLRFQACVQQQELLDLINLLNKMFCNQSSLNLKLFHVSHFNNSVKEATPTIQEAESVRPRSLSRASACKSLTVH